ncbi:MAG: hypothetical protein WA087_02865 [Candidatus Saccharimonadales bacterium]
MSNRNIKRSASGGYYYLRADSSGGVSIFQNDNDYQKFLSMMNNNLTKNDSVEATAYCLNPDHFCLLLKQNAESGVTDLMHRVITGYNKYYFDKYHVEDKLSESDYQVSVVEAGELLDTSRCIHKSADDWADCEYSSVRAYLYDDKPTWLNKKYIIDLAGSAVNYFDFLRA